MKRYFLIAVLCVAASCSKAASTDMPEWRWPDPEEPETPEAVEAHPAIVA